LATPGSSNNDQPSQVEIVGTETLVTPGSSEPSSLSDSFEDPQNYNSGGQNTDSNPEPTTSMTDPPNMNSQTQLTDGSAGLNEATRSKEGYQEEDTCSVDVSHSHGQLDDKPLKKKPGKKTTEKNKEDYRIFCALLPIATINTISKMTNISSKRASDYDTKATIECIQKLQEPPKITSISELYSNISQYTKHTFSQDSIVTYDVSENSLTITLVNLNDLLTGQIDTSVK
jgi:hypothetical protein